MPPETRSQKTGPSRPPLIRPLYPTAFGIAAAISSPALALSLGPATTHGYIGTPLRIEIPLQTGIHEEADVECIHLAGTPQNYSDDIPWLTHGNLSIETSATGRLLVIRAAAIRQPAFMLGLRSECGINLQRDYTVLLDPPPFRTVPADNGGGVATATAATPQPSLPLPPPPLPGSRWQIQPGDSAWNIATRLAPGRRGTQRQLAAEILALNAGSLPADLRIGQALPAGLEISLPPLPTTRIAAGTPIASRPAPLRQGSPATAPTNARKAARDTVIVTGGGDLRLRLSTHLGEAGAPASDSTAPPGEQRLLAELDEKTASQVELRERLRQLEALQARLQEETAQLAQALQKSPPAQHTPEIATAPASVPGITSALAPAPVRLPVAAPSVPAMDSGRHWIVASLVAGLLAIAGGALAFLGRRRRRHEKADGDTLPLPAFTEADVLAGGTLGTPLSEADIWPDHQGHAPSISEQARTSARANIGQFTASGLGPASLLHVIEHDVEEHDSAIELAEIMLSFGRVQGAAQTLADYIRNNPKRAIKPWLKLLEVYRTADMRIEFSALMQQLHRNFNIKATDWDSFDVTRRAADSLEDMPHIVDRLLKLWRTRECQAFLYRLLRDNRDGTRQGFPLPMVDEILLLLSILEQELGPYRSGDHEETATATATAETTYQQAGTAASPRAAPRETGAPLKPDLPVTSTFTQSGRFPPLSPTSPAQEPVQSFLNLDFELDLEDQQTQGLDPDSLPTPAPPEDKTKPA